MRHYFLEKALLPIGDIISRQHIMKRFKYLQEAQWYDKSLIYEQRNRMLSNIIQVAYSDVPFYRNLFESAGVIPSDVKSPKDLCKLPVVTKDMLRSFPLSIISRNTGMKAYEQRTSGSTGSNFCVLVDAETAGWYRATFMLSLQWAGWDIGEKHFQTGMTTNRGFLKKIKDIILGCHYASAYLLDNETIDRHLDVLLRKKIRHIWGYPGSLFYISKRALEKGLILPMKSVVTWGDTLTATNRKLIESVFKCRVTDTYGCAEGMHIAAQCGADSRYHIHSLDVIVEILDDNDEPVENGKPGNIVLTRLHPGPIPFIRYKIGDIGTISKDQSCICGRSFDILESIEGRTADTVITPSGNKLIVHYFTGILEHYEEIKNFQILQDKYDEITLFIESDSIISDSIRVKIIDSLKNRGADDLKIIIKQVENIDLNATGKRRFVVNKISHGR